MSEDLVNSLQNTSKSVDAYGKFLSGAIDGYHNVDPTTRYILKHIVDTTFSALSQLFNYSAFNARTIHNLGNAVEKLPSSHEVDGLKKAFRHAVKVNEEQREFIKKATRYFDDMKKDLEKT